MAQRCPVLPWLDFLLFECISLILVFCPVLDKNTCDPTSITPEKTVPVTTSPAPGIVKALSIARRKLPDEKFSE